jgi:formylglycine-generating enzyme required for sulfatase activity
MQFPISDAAAIALSREFYGALADGYPIDAALSEARKAVAEEGGPFEWGTPVLFSRSDDNRLLEPATGDARPVVAIQPFEPETVLVPAGPFLMGSPAGPGVAAHETPQSEIMLDDYRIGKFPVTNREYEVFLRETHRRANAEMRWDGQSPFPGEERHPVTGVNWCDALAYCRWLSERTGRRYPLPGEAHWEKAARGADGRLYPWGDEWTAGRCNQGQAGLVAVDAYPAQSACGCYDMVGNAPEWTSTLWGQAVHEPDARYCYPWRADGRDDLGANSQVRRVVRGGAAADPIDKLRCAARASYLPLQYGPLGKRYGFRVMMLLTPASEASAASLAEPFCGSE